MREKLLKLVKRLYEFTLYDVVLLSEIEESIVKAYLNEFLFYGIIRTKDGNRYVFLKMPDVQHHETPVVETKLSDAINKYIKRGLKDRVYTTSRGGSGIF